MKERATLDLHDAHPGPAPCPVTYAFLRAAHAIEKRMEESLAAVALSGAKFASLSKLVDAGQPLTLTELASRLTCVRSNITQLVDRLESDGLVRRVEDSSDRRSVRAELTALGRLRQAAGAKKMKELHKELEQVFAGVDRAPLDRALAKLAEGPCQTGPSAHDLDLKPPR